MKDVWEDGVSLTSGRSGLASAVIYQPSCHQSYSQDCIASLSSNKEYDDDRKPPDANDDDGDISSHGGAGSSFHLNCSSNFFSNSGRSKGNRENELAVEVDCERIKERLSADLFHMMREMRVKLKESCNKSEPNDQELQQQLDQSHVVKLAKFHINCKKHKSCPLQTLKRRFRQFIHSSKDRSSCDKLCKSKGT